MTAPSWAAAEPGFVVALERYNGPLDLLLSLIRKEEIDIWDIPIARIADQFHRAIEQLGLDEASEYLEMAARLLRIKAAMLLPQRGDQEAWEDPRHELVRRLLEYQQIREVVDWMERAQRRRAERFSRAWLPPAPEVPLPPPVFDLVELVQALEHVLQMMPDPIMYRIAPRPLDVEGAQRRLLDWLAERERFLFGELLGDGPSVVDILSALVALLELARRSRSNVEQRTRLLEAALFAAPRPLALDELAILDAESSEDDWRRALDELRDHYEQDGHGVELVEIAEGWQILTRPIFAEAIERAQFAARPLKLSGAALEVMSIIAYRQPVGRAEIEEIRGVSSGGVLRLLQERGMIEVSGRADALGRPLLYATTPLFLEHLGLRDIADLPRTEELAVALRTPSERVAELQAEEAAAAAAEAAARAADVFAPQPDQPSSSGAAGPETA